MPSTNGHGHRRAVLYARVSGDEQAKKGYSLPDQRQALREWAAGEGYEILEEVADEGWSGAYLERPGLDRVRDLVEAGGVDAVVALFRDRIARGVYVQILKEEFARRGTRLVALNAQTDDSPEGELHGGILDQFAAYERAKIAERTRRGRLRKAREGKIVATGSRPNYGFDFDRDRTGYVVNEREADVVRRIFRMVGEEGHTLNSVKKALEADGVPPPGPGKHWHVTTMSSILASDCYRPHALEELKELVSPEVASRLDPDARYGVFYYGRRRSTSRPVAEQGPDGQRRYRRRQSVTQRPREEWIAVPVPDIGLAAATVRAARDSLKVNRRPSAAGDRFWELSGGVMFCEGCGRRMSPDRRLNSSGAARVYFYYRCPKRRIDGPGACPNARTQRAERAEAAVWQSISGLLLDPGRLRRGLEEMLERERTAVPGDLSRQAAVWAGRLEKMERKRSNLQDMAAEGLITFEELRAKLGALQGDHAQARQELDAVLRRKEKIVAAERDAEELLDSYAAAMPEHIRGLGPQERRRVYQLMKVRAVARCDGGIELSGFLGGADSLCVTPSQLHGRQDSRGRGRRRGGSKA